MVQSQRLAAPATEQGGEHRIAQDGKPYAWKQSLRHYGSANALWHWRAAPPSSVRPADHDGSAATEQACPDDVYTTVWGLYEFMCMFGDTYLG